MSSRSSAPEHLLRLTPAVLTAAAIALEVLVALAPALLPGAWGSAAVLTFLVLPSVVVAGYGSRRLISVQSVVVVASCGVVLATAADPPVPTAATAISVTAAILASVAVVVVLRCALERAAAEARAHAALDPLTAAVNRRGLEDAAVALLHDGRRRAQTVGAIMLDVDDFKAINDGFGHEAGDRVLQEVCAAIRSCVRSDDIVARLGGEEFAVLTVLPPADLAELGERIRRRVAERCGNLAVTATLGVTWADPAASSPPPGPAGSVAAHRPRRRPDVSGEAARTRPGLPRPGFRLTTVTAGPCPPLPGEPPRTTNRASARTGVAWRR